MAAKVIARRGDEQFLVDIGEGSGRVFDARETKLYPPFELQRLLDRGYWQPVIDVSDELMAQVNAELGVTDSVDFVTQPATPAEISTEGPGTFALTLIDESTPTVDGRVFEPGQVNWREPPIPLMFLTENTHDGHKGSKVGGVITEIAREGTKIIGKGRFDSGENGQELRRLIREQVLTGISADVGGALVQNEMAEDGTQRSRITSGRIMGATALPFPAFDETRIAVTAAAIPENPPLEWFEDPKLADRTAITITADGRVLGHAATWGTCHIGRKDTCLTAPKSRANYAYFTTGEVYAADGTSVPVGPITLGTGHASLSLGYRQAAEHYDDTGTAVADVRVGEDVHGIWVAGALRPGIGEERIRSLRASALSGDWRSIGGGLELVALLAVNTPGFPIPRARANFQDEHPVAMVAAGFLDNGEGQESGDNQEDGAEGKDGTEWDGHEMDDPDVGTDVPHEDLFEYAARIEQLEAAVVALAQRAAARRAAELPPFPVKN